MNLTNLLLPKGKKRGGEGVELALLLYLSPSSIIILIALSALSVLNTVESRIIMYVLQ